jgi:O-antigen ligase
MLLFQKLSEKIFVVISLILFSGAIGGFIADDNPLSIIKITFAYVGHFLTLLLILARWKKVLAIICKEKILWVLVGLTLASPLWSDIPLFTLEHIMPLFRVTVFGIYFAARFNMKEQLQLLAWAFGIAAILSLLVCIAVPYYGVVGVGLIVGQEEIVHTGSWRGIYIHKTFLGSIMSIGSLIFLFCGIGKYKYPWIIWPCFFLTIFMLLRSTTTAALGILLVIMIMIPCYRLLRINFTLFLSLFLGLFLLASTASTAIATNADSIFNYIGKEPTISGRTLMWPLLLDKIWKRPWFGYGYETFWEGGWEGEPSDIWRGLIGGFEPPHAHNGFLELWVDIGLIGLAIFTVSFATALWRSLVWLQKNKSVEGIVPIIFLTQLILLNLTESYLMRSDIYWLLYVTLTLSMYQQCPKKYLLIPQANQELLPI